MIYHALSDMLLDNRRGLESRLKELGASKEVMEESLITYDWLAGECLKNRASYSALKKSAHLLYDTDSVDTLEKLSLKFMGDILTADSEYRYDVEHGRKVGYSVADEEVEMRGMALE